MKISCYRCREKGITNIIGSTENVENILISKAGEYVCLYCKVEDAKNSMALNYYTFKHSLFYLNQKAIRRIEELDSFMTQELEDEEHYEDYYEEIKFLNEVIDNNHKILNALDKGREINIITYR